MKELFFIVGLLALIGAGCSISGVNEEAGEPLLEVLDSTETGINFVNSLTPSLDLNVFNYMYFYNGGGVAAGDFNNDGLEDLYFTANQLPNRLYLNNGNMKFQDVTAQSGTAGSGNWKTGVATVDINNDGLLDIYVSQVADYRSISGRNELFVNMGPNPDGIPVFEEKAADYGLDLEGFGTQAAFFDYDNDGDLDIFQMNHSLHANGTFGKREIFDTATHELSGDRLLRNDNGRYTDVTRSAGILSTVIGYGLGVVPTDINNDGFTDLYVANDFHENDYLYINQGNGTFKEELTSRINHTSRFSMGVDVADINNDGHSEIMSLDMHPEDPIILKSSLGEDDYGIFQFKLGYGYNHQYARNNLQLNNANGTFSEIGVYAGVHATDWSWAVLFADLDNNGLKDIFVSNGIPKRMNDIDYVDFVSNDEVQFRISTDNMETQDLALTDKLPEIKIPNKVFVNNGQLKFTDSEGRIRNDRPTYSNGAAYADLDNDGDLDVIVNNIGDSPFIYKNLSREESSTEQHYLSLNLTGDKSNIKAYGARVIVDREADKIITEHFPQRGYQSSTSQRVHVGLGDDLSIIRSITLVWPNGKSQLISTEQLDTTIAVAYDVGNVVDFDFEVLAQSDKQSWLTDITDESGIDFVHSENSFVEFNREQLLPHMLSTEGPAVAIGDINGDGRDDIFMGNAKWEHSAIYVQGSDGSFQKTMQPALKQDSVFEDVDAFFADLDSDGDKDLFVASGGNEFYGTMEPMKSRVYLNDDGIFNRKSDALDSVFVTASCVLPNDFNGDGYVDLFLGARTTPWKYGKIPRSYLLANDGTGRFKDVTNEYSDDLAFAGFVKNGQWVDIDSDGDQDLLLAVEWGAITLYRNNGSSFTKEELPGGSGWWNTVTATDIDLDGDIDIIAGGSGENTKFHPSEDQPLNMYVGDLDKNNQIEQILEYYVEDQKTVFPTYREVTRQIPEVKKQFLFAKDFAKASVSDLAGERMAETKKYTADNFSHVLLENQGGGGGFAVKPLPQRTQFSTVNAIYIGDVDGDSNPDVITGGNFYENNIELGRYDASYGDLILTSSAEISERDTYSLNISGQIRNIVPLRVGDTPAILFMRNNEAPVLMAVKTDGNIQ